jgi:hypothetical protein
MPGKTSQEYNEKRGLQELVSFSKSLQHDKPRRESFWRTLINNCDIPAKLTLGWQYPAPQQLEIGYSSQFEGLTHAEGLDDKTIKDLNIRYGRFYRNIHHRSFFTTKSGYMGLGPFACKSGDVAVVLLGGELCFVLRPVETGKFELVGDAYVHGAMNGEMIKVNEAGDISNLEKFVLC